MSSTVSPENVNSCFPVQNRLHCWEIISCLTVGYRRRWGPWWTTCSHLGFSRRKQEVIPGFVYKRNRVATGRRVFVSLIGLTSVLLTVQLVRNMCNESSRPGSLGPLFFAGDGALRVNCTTLAANPDEEEDWRALWKRLLILKWRSELAGRCIWLLLFLSLWLPLQTVAKFCSTSSGSRGQPSVDCLGLFFTAHVDVARDDIVEDDDGVLWMRTLAN